MIRSAGEAVIPGMSSFVEELRARGLRVTSARKQVLEALLDADEPTSAERIAERREADLASVYRNLDTLESHGLVRHFHLGHGPGLYALAQPEREYLVCDGCGAVRPVPPHALDDVRTLLARRFRLVAAFGHFPIVGRCEDCT
jgi:Fur family ferric uptake transcriptional regulator